MRSSSTIRTVAVFNSIVRFLHDLAHRSFPEFVRAALARHVPQAAYDPGDPVRRIGSPVCVWVYRYLEERPAGSAAFELSLVKRAA
jgi:hypothetical protein